MSCMTLSSQEKYLFLLFPYFRAHPTTLLLKILGGRMHGPSPHLKLCGKTAPQSLIGFLPCIYAVFKVQKRLFAAFELTIAAQKCSTALRYIIKCYSKQQRAKAGSLM